MDMSTVGRLIGEPARAAMLDALLSGQALRAGELAKAAGVRPPTASGHLHRLRTGGLVDVVQTGRYRYYRLAGPEVAEALEALSLLGAAGRPVRSLREARAAQAFTVARTCYDHLAGQVGVAVHDALVARAALVAGGDGYLLTGAGEDLFGRLGVPVDDARRTRRRFARPCLDLTERRPHLAGALGAAVCARTLELGWLVRRPADGRALRLTDAGRQGLVDALGVTLPAGPSATP